MYSTVERLVDVVVVAVLLGVTPVQATVAMAVRRALGPPVLFRQQRPGRHGRPITLLKFPTAPAAERPITSATDADRLPAVQHEPGAATDAVERAPWGHEPGRSPPPADDVGWGWRRMPPAWRRRPWHRSDAGVAGPRSRRSRR